MPQSAVVVFPNVAAREAIKKALAERFALHCVGAAASPAEALSVVERTTPDVVIVGQHLVNAAEVLDCRNLRAVSPASRLIMLTWYARERDPLISLLAGASACLLLEIGAIDALAAVIERVAAGENLIYLERGEHLAQLLGPSGPFADAGQREVMARVFQLQTDADIAQALGMAPEDVHDSIGEIVRMLTPASGLY